ncbi:molybdate ABC transporter substrate-binding protein [Rhodalgimonas zhirmunskyi]|nr:molybdate ABC transporter substrate-binding protein [Rhodoalgimonas zhirmunskyi]
MASLCALLLALCTPLRADEITIFAASSLKTALDTASKDFEEQTGHNLTLVYAGSSALARQIAQGAPADLFLSANPGWMDVLESENRLAPGTRRDLLSNQLVLISHDAGAPIALNDQTDLATLLGGGRLATALVDAVPAGIYAKAALQNLHLWDQAEPRLAQAKNVRAALALVQTGAAPLGITYATDAHAAGNSVHIRATFPAASHPPIIYPAAALANGNVAGARAFLAYLSTPPAQAAFTAEGFALLPAPGDT